MKRDALVKGLDCLNEFRMKFHGKSNGGSDASVVTFPADQMDGIIKTSIPIR